MFKTKVINGITLPEGDNHFEWHLMRESYKGAGAYQYHKLKAALEIAPDRRGIALDVGGHVGLWSRILCDHFKEVHAFEPVPELINCFKINAPKAILHETALGDFYGTVNIEFDPDNTGQTYINGMGNLTVPIMPLDGQYANPRYNIDFIKIDVEGYEGMVIKGARGIIERYKPVIVVECKHDMANRYTLPSKGAITLLEEMGAKVVGEIYGDYFLSW